MILRVNPENLCDNHLRDQHRQIHIVWPELQKPERKRSDLEGVKLYAGQTRALYRRHQRIVSEMLRRDMSHNSELQHDRLVGTLEEPERKSALSEEIEMLREKQCDCFR